VVGEYEGIYEDRNWWFGEAMKHISISINHSQSQQDTVSVIFS